jgi:16S rRNA (cytosine1402-N4)-methyltransferase
MPHDANNGAHPEGAPQKYATGYHAPVLCKTVVDELITDLSGVYVDATLGGGGHAAALLDALDPSGRVIGIDRDPEALAAARDRLRGAEEAGRFQAVHGSFGDLGPLLDAEGIVPVDGLLLDLGVSSHQIDAAERGFSFQQEGPLDMRMNPRTGLTAHQVVNAWGEDELKQAFYRYGEERRAPQVTRAIVAARPIQTTGALADVIRSAVPERDEIKTLARIFQAIRIVVNDELGELERVLEQAESVVRPDGRIAVISYHSLEDRRVKRYLRYGNFEGEPVRDLYGTLIAPWSEVNRKPIRASEAEVKANPRARSARLRIAERRTDTDDATPAPNP